jgi:hypothetical protein
VASPGTSRTQRWFHDLSARLQTSFQASDQIKHRVTVGESREHQILDVLAQLLPKQIAVGRNVVIVDSADAESRKFDGVLIDRRNWPLLFAQDALQIAMIESVVAAIEIKSSLDLSDLEDIMQKTEALRAMRCDGDLPNVTAFAYKCSNRSLAFFDYAVALRRSPRRAPNLVCVLNDGLFGTASPDTDAVFPFSDTAASRPALLATDQDTLLIYLYLLSRWASSTPSLKTFEHYSQKLFSTVQAFQFDDDFLDILASDDAAHSAARQCFVRRTKEDINLLYQKARSALHLEPT